MYLDTSISYFAHDYVLYDYTPYRKVIIVLSIYILDHSGPIDDLWIAFYW